MLYGPAVWDPVLITAQIVAVQCCFYLGVGLLMAMLVAPYAPRLALFHIFDWHAATFHTFQGWMVFIAFFINAFAVGATIKALVKRAIKCLDYAATAYFVHLVAVAVYSGGLPRTATWWLCAGVDLAVTALFAEWLCIQEEMKEIPLASIPRRRGGDSAVQLTSVVTEPLQRSTV